MKWRMMHLNEYGHVLETEDFEDQGALKVHLLKLCFHDGDTIEIQELR
jgi:hypothetical protein